MYNTFKSHLTKELQDIKDAGLYKQERIITTPQKAGINVAGADAEIRLRHTAGNIHRCACIGESFCGCSWLPHW